MIRSTQFYTYLKKTVLVSHRIGIGRYSEFLVSDGFLKMELLDPYFKDNKLLRNDCMAGWGCFFREFEKQKWLRTGQGVCLKGLFFLLWTHQLVQLLKQREQLSPVYRCWFVRAFSGALRNALFSRVCFWGFLSSQTDFKEDFLIVDRICLSVPEEEWLALC